MLKRGSSLVGIAIGEWQIWKYWNCWYSARCATVMGIYCLCWYCDWLHCGAVRIALHPNRNSMKITHHPLVSWCFYTNSCKYTSKSPKRNQENLSDPCSAQMEWQWSEGGRWMNGWTNKRKRKNIINKKALLMVLFWFIFNVFVWIFIIFSSRCPPLSWLAGFGC